MKHARQPRPRPPLARARRDANAGADLECVVVRSDQEPVVVNLAIEPIERPEAVYWVDPAHPAPKGTT